MFKMDSPSKMVMLVTLISIVTAGAFGMHVTHTFRDIDGQHLHHMDFNQASGDIVVGATNSLSKLSRYLNLQQTASIKGHNSKSTYPKGVVINKALNTVILCSTNGGVCESRSLGNLSTILYHHRKPLVPMDESTNNVLLLTSHSNSQKLHIANDFKKDGTTSLDDIPTLSTRAADSFSLLHEDMEGYSAKYVRSQNLADGYFVQYIYAFSYGNYMYHISRHPSALNNAIVSSKISRICLTDKYYRSYVEIQLDCLANSVTFFSHARAAHFDSVTQKLFLGFTNENQDATSALCVFNIADINTKMDKTVHSCYQGNGKLGPAHLHKISSCIDTSSPADMCGQSDVSEAYPSIEGQTPIFQRPVISLPHTIITSLTTRVEGQVTLVYLGTDDGSVKKVTLSSSGVVSVVSEINIDLGQSVLSPMFLDSDGHFLYAMTQSKLVKVDVDHCEERTTCQECTSSLDTMCGWCVLQNRCSKQKNCPSAAISPTWLPAKNGVCAEMKDVYPNILSYESLESDSNRKISFKLDKISVVDPANIDLHCSFVLMETKHITMATIDGDKITCPLPPRAKLPTLPQGVVRAADGDHRKLEVEFQILGKTVVKRDLSLYDCGINLSCGKCVDSKFGCKWCHARGMCRDAVKADCLNQTLPAVKSASQCPRLETSSHDTDIVVHSGQTKKIAVRVANLQPDQYHNIHCLFTYLGEVKISPGKVTSSNLLCDPLTFSFNDTSLPIETADFTVTAGNNSVPLDNPQEIKVRIYKCGPMVTNCGQCLSMDPEYECGWCTHGDPQCSLMTDCRASDWLNRESTCPDPQILRFNPLAGPIQGVTNISVHGLNLGKSYSDLEVTVAGVRCVVLPQHYESSQRFDCETTGPSKVTDGVISVKVKNLYTTESDSHFMFVEPNVTSLAPKNGPASGGTTLAINGEYMNAGTMTTVDIGGAPCAVVKSNMTMLECVTPQQVTNDNKAYVEVNFGNLRKLVPTKFTYEKDPDITMLEPTNAFLSGGTSITAMGSQMQYIQKPQFFVEHAGSQKTTDCSLQPLTMWLVCKTPRLNFPGENITETSPKEVHYGFNLDGVTMYRNISKDPKFKPLLYYPDPEVEKFPPNGENVKKYEEQDMMIIKGNFRRVNPFIKEVSVTVGGAECTKPTATDTALSCKAPEQPKLDNNGNAVVMLQIGNMQTEVGYLSYYETNKEEKPIAIGIILGVVLPIIAIIILLTICVVRRHRKHKPSENYIPDVWKDTEAKKDEEDEIGMNHVSVKADMNGSIPDDKDTEPYIEELLSKIEDDAIRHNVKHFLISRRRLDIGDLLGKGNFGVTCKATYTRTEEDNPTDVAVKTVQGTKTDSDSVSSFLQTVTMYRDLQHPGIAPIIGVCITVSDDPMLVLPYARNGDLKSYVRDSDRSLTVLELLGFGLQVAEAMAYLESVHVIHGNLALRNCLVTDDKKIQVCDYGLTKELFNKEQYFKEDDKTKSIIKWAAPETMETVEFTSQSDVWSYGIVLWELLTRGVTPYPDVENSDLQEYLEKGSRMKKPRQCPENIYELVLRCWAQESEVRPTFHQVASEIQTFTTADNDEQSTGDATPLQNKIDVDSASEFI